jgi:hypothetical protein
VSTLRFCTPSGFINQQQIGIHRLGECDRCPLIRDNLEASCVIDPANTNNVISDDLTAPEKKKIADQAANSRNEPYWEQVLW